MRGIRWSDASRYISGKPAKTWTFCRNHKPAYSWGRPAYSWRTASAPGRPGPPAARGMAAIGALIACAAAATGLAPSLHLASLGMPRAATSGVPPAASRLPGGSSSLEET